MRAETAPTMKYESLWLEPVADVASLPVLAAEGQLCFVQDRDEVYVFHGGRWQVVRPAKA